MRLLTRVRHRVYRLLGIVSPSGTYASLTSRSVRRAAELVAEGPYRIEFWDESGKVTQTHEGTGLRVTKLSPCGNPIGRECGGDPFDSRPCKPACCPHEATPVHGDPEAGNGPQEGVQGC